MRFHEFSEPLCEGRDAPLYHATGLKRAINIIKKNKIGALTTASQAAVKGVSLTRSRAFAHLWSQADWADSWQRAVFVLDQRRLVADGHRLVPEQHEESSRFGGDQAEEFHVGPILNLDRYLLAIEVSEWSMGELKRELEDYGFERGNTIDDVTEMEVRQFLRHPKLKIVPGQKPTTWRQTPLANRPNATKHLRL